MKSISHASNDKSSFVFVITGVAALGGLLFGYDTGVISGAILFIKADYRLSSILEELVVSAVLMGAVIGAAVGGILADRYGRRRMLIISAIIFTVGAVATALAPGVGLLFAGRIVVGVAIGVASFVSPLYISEISPPAMRGTLVSINQLALTSGIVIAYVVDLIFAGIHGWRFMLGLSALPSLVLGIAMGFLPNSPRWLLLADRQKEARAVLARINVTGNADEELKEMLASIEAEKGGGVKRLFRPALRLALLVGVGLALFQQLTGINTVIYYAPTILEFAGFKTAEFSLVATVGVGLVNVAFTVVAARLMDTTGRRPLLLIGVAGQFIGLVLLALAFQLSQFRAVVGIIAVVSLVIYVAAFAIGLGPVFWLMIAEIYPLKVRGAAMSIATVVNWGINLLVALTFLTLIELIGRSGTFWLYAAITVLAWIFIYMLVPETKGHTLEEIEEHWRRGRHPRKLQGKMTDKSINR